MLYRLTLSSSARRFPVSAVLLPFASADAARVFAEDLKRLFALAWPEHADLVISVKRIDFPLRKPEARDDED
jgi:hypothetical protein